jgi:hypothetical protein
VDPHSGAVGVLFYDARNDPNNKKVQAWASISADGGATWTEGPLATAQSDQSQDNGSRLIYNYLEYIGLDMRDGTLQAVWADNRENLADLEVYTASAAIVSSGNELRIRGDDAGPTNDTITVRRSSVNADFIEVRFGSTIRYAGLLASVGSITIDGVSGNDTITIGNALGVPVTINGGEGTDTININESAPGTPVTVTPSTGLDTINVNTDPDGGAAEARFPDGMTLAALNIGVNGTVKTVARPTPNSPEGTLVVQSLSIAGTPPSAMGKLDLTNNSMIVDYTGPVGSLVNDTRLHLREGRLITGSAGTPLGTRLGYGDNAVLGRTTFAGQTVDSSSLLVKFTYAGDTNLDGQVDITDLGTLATNWQTSGPWTSGDVDSTYDGFIDITDLGDLATNWQAGVGAPLFVGGPDPEQSFLEGIEKLELSEDEIAKLLEMLNTESLPTL